MASLKIRTKKCKDDSSIYFSFYPGSKRNIPSLVGERRRNPHRLMMQTVEAKWLFESEKRMKVGEKSCRCRTCFLQVLVFSPSVGYSYLRKKVRNVLPPEVRNILCQGRTYSSRRLWDRLRSHFTASDRRFCATLPSKQAVAGSSPVSRSYLFN